MFLSRYDDHDRFFTCAGHRLQTEYIEVIKPNGNPGLEAVGQIDLVELHQQDRDSVDIPQIVARYRNGDITALDCGAHPMYYDRTLLPDDPAEVIALMRDLTAKYGPDLGKAIDDLVNANNESSAAPDCNIADGDIVCVGAETAEGVKTE